MKMEPGQIDSILRRQGAAEEKIGRTEGGLRQRVEKVKPKVEEQYARKEGMEEIIAKAKELLEIYQDSSRIPVRALRFEKTGFDDARLLALCEIIEYERWNSENK
jgi:hypothetical protein